MLAATHAVVHPQQLTRTNPPPKGAALSAMIRRVCCTFGRATGRGYGMNDDPSGAPIGEDARIDALDKRLKALREREEERNRPKAGAETDANYRMGNRVLAELIGGLAGGAFIGWVIDQFAGTSPWGLLVMLFMGVFVAFRNIIRISSRRPD
jgi:ATP synthase protein I